MVAGILLDYTELLVSQFPALHPHYLYDFALWVSAWILSVTYLTYSALRLLFSIRKDPCQFLA